MFQVDRRWCIYCFGEARRRLAVKFYNHELGLVVEYQAPVCLYCYRERTRPLTWHDVPAIAERIKPLVNEGCLA